MHPISAVLIDAGRVLIHPDDTHFQRAAHHVGVPLPAGTGPRALGHTVWESARSPDPIAFWNTDAKIAAWSRHAGLTTAAGNAVWHHVHHLDRTDTPLWSQVEPTAAVALRALTAAGYRVAVVSNNDGRLHRQLTTAGLADSCTAIIDSAVLGTAKPDPAIFHHAAALLDVPPAACLMIGDDPFFDIHAAINAGIRHTILIDHDQHRPPSWTSNAAPTIGAAAEAIIRSAMTDR